MILAQNHLQPLNGSKLKFEIFKIDIIIFSRHIVFRTLHFAIVWSGKRIC